MTKGFPVSRRSLFGLSLATSGSAIAERLFATIPVAKSQSPSTLLPPMPREAPLDWHERANAFDRYVFDPVNRVLQKRSDGTYYFASALEGTGDGGLTTFAPILLGKILRGDPVNWLAPSMAAYYSDRHGIFLDGRHADSCEYWYLMNVNALAAGVVRAHLSHDAAWTARVRSSADRLISLARQVNYDFNAQGYQFDSRTPWTKQDIYRQPDAIGGYAYLMLMAHAMFGDQDYLGESRAAVRRYLSFPRNPWYEVPSGAMACLAAARLSILDPNINVGRALAFVLDSGGHPLHTGSWGGVEVGGLMAGFRTEPAGEAYSMESLVTAGYLLPVVRYHPEYAGLIGRYILNTAANMRHFYSDCIARENQSRPDLTSAIPYERLSRTLNGKSPYAAGDYGSHRSIYGGAYALWWSELVKPTSEQGILALNVTATDFLEPKHYPTHLYYNPFDRAKRVTLPAVHGEVLYYDLGGHRFLDATGDKPALLDIPAGQARVIVSVPRASPAELRNGTLFFDGIAVDYAPRT